MSEEKGNNEDKKEIEIISGDGSNLEISPVYEHINAAKPESKDKKPKNIIIPKEGNSKEKNSNEN